MLFAAFLTSVLAALAAASPSPSSSPQLPAATGSTAAPPGQVPASPAATGAPTPGATKAASSPPRPLRATGAALGGAVSVEVRDLPPESAQAALQAALAEISEIERLTDPQPQRSSSPAVAGQPAPSPAATSPSTSAQEAGQGLAALNAAAGKGPIAVDRRLLDALARALDFCEWSENRNGPLGLDLYRLWGLRQTPGASPVILPPPPELLLRAAGAATCGNLTLDQRKGTANLAAGCALDLGGLAQGIAVDRAIAVLRNHGSANAFVEIGDVRRGLGDGRDGRGWPVDLPDLAAGAEPAARVLLRNQALAVASAAGKRMQWGEQSAAPFINQRTGQPAEGVLATLAVTELAADAQALAITMAVTGSRDGELLMGSIRPRPSVLWLLGSGTGSPLLIDYRWAEVAKR